MDREKENLFGVVAQGDDETLQRLLLEGKEERNIATLAVSLRLEVKSKQFVQMFSFFSARQHSSSRGILEWIQPMREDLVQCLSERSG